MAAAPIIYLSQASVKLGTTPTEYNGHCTVAEVTVEAGEESSVTTLDGTKHSRTGSPTYKLHLVYGQDWSTAGLANYLFAQKGTTVPFTISAYGTTPPSPTAPAMTGSCVIQPGTYGGEADTWIEGEVELSIIGTPTLMTTAALMADEEDAMTAALEDSDVRVAA